MDKQVHTGLLSNNVLKPRKRSLSDMNGQKKQASRRGHMGTCKKINKERSEDNIYPFYSLWGKYPAPWGGDFYYASEMFKNLDTAFLFIGAKVFLSPILIWALGSASLAESRLGLCQSQDSSRAA